MLENKQAKKDSSRIVFANNSRMGDRDFEKFSEFIKREFGIKMPPSKKTMLEARLQKRLRALCLNNHSEYCKFLFSPEGLESEITHLIDVVTTNTTDFFREPKHFEMLLSTILPDFLKRNKKNIKIWSAGCSSGEEPYTLAMVLSEFAAKNASFDFSILATDISNEILQKAITAIYPMEKVEIIPMALKKKYLLKSKDRSKNIVRIAPELRRKVDFKRLNFMEPFPFKEKKDIIFCRNVVIYFDRPTQYKLFNEFCMRLVSGGFLFIGHSESISGMGLPVKQVAPTVYQRI